MQDYYQQTYFSDLPDAALQLSFVGTLSMVFANSMGPFAQILSSYFGTRVVMLIGTLFIAIGLFMAGFAYEVITSLVMQTDVFTLFVIKPTDLASLPLARHFIWNWCLLDVCGKYSSCFVNCFHVCMLIDK